MQTPLANLARLATLGLCAALLAPSAHADKFYFSTAEEDQALPEGSQPSYLEGVLLREEENRYVIRVEGGEVQIPKAQVKRIEKDGLTVEQLADREDAAKERLAAANRARDEVGVAEASARGSARATEAAARSNAQEATADRMVNIVVDFQRLLPDYTFRTYDPVLRRANFSGLAQVIENYLSRQVLDAAHRSPTQR